MKTCRLLLVAIFLICTIGILTTSISGCKKSNIVVTNDTIINPPPLPIDTILYVKKIEETFLQNNPSIISRTRDYNFYYDTQKRLIKVGIKNYGAVLYDSLTTSFSYIGNNKKPSVVIMADASGSSIGGPAYYDTTYFTYGANETLLKDSTNERTYNFATSSYYRTPLYRLYSYPNNSILKVDWYWYGNGNTTTRLWRTDTLSADASKITNLKTVFFYDIPNYYRYALGEVFIPSTYINPLSKLNISGTNFSYIYANTKNEILGNSNHYLITGTNILAYYLDFISPYLPTQFYLSPYSSNGVLVGSQGQFFSTEISPLLTRPKYPELLKVEASTSFPGDKFQYRYFYY